MDELNEKLEKLKEQVERGPSQSDLIRALPGALQVGTQKSSATAGAFQAAVSHNLGAAIRKSRHDIAQAVVPIVGPSIRSFVLSLLRDLTLSLNQVIEQSFTLQGLKWRYRAWQTKRPLSEIVFADTLVYRVELVVLIRKECGTHLQSAFHSCGNAATRESMISSMLSALSQFVTEAFDPKQKQELKTVTTDDLTVVLEQCGEALVAALVRGVPPPDLKIKLKGAAEEIADIYSESFADFNGDTTNFDGASATLESLLLSREKNPKKERRGFFRSNLKAIVVLCTLLITLFVAAGYHLHNEFKTDSAVSEYLHELGTLPGLHVTRVSGNKSHGFDVYGLKDPLQQSLPTLSSFLPNSEIPFRFHWSPIVSLHEKFTLHRLKNALAETPPGDHVDFKMNGSVLSVSGRTTHEWIQNLLIVSRALPGIEGVDHSQLTNSNQRNFDQVVEEIEKIELHFRSLTEALKRAEVYLPLIARLELEAQKIEKRFFVRLQARPRRGFNPLQFRVAVVDKIAGRLGWKLQQRGITRYRIIRTHALDPARGNKSFHTLSAVVKIQVDKIAQRNEAEAD